MDIALEGKKTSAFGAKLVLHQRKRSGPSCALSQGDGDRGGASAITTCAWPAPRRVVSALLPACFLQAGCYVCIQPLPRDVLHGQGMPLLFAKGAGNGPCTGT